MIDRIIFSLAHLVFTDSLSQKKFLIENNIGNEEKLRVLNKGSFSGVDLQRFSREACLEEALKEKQRIFPDFSGKILLYLGRINNDKGIVELGKAFFSLQDRHRLKLLVVGPKDELDLTNQKMLEDLQKNSDVVFQSFTNSPELYLTLADIYCLPSYREGCPTTILEASACKTAVVASDIYGIRDVVLNHITGVLCEVRNATDLTQKINGILLDEVKIKEMGDRGREFVEKNFDQKLLTKLMIKEYDQMLEKMK